MKKFDKILRPAACAVSFLALAGVVLPVAFYCFNAIELAPMKHWLFAATVVWFIATPFWMEREKQQ
ncbi:MAG: hypothetical protein HPZ91_00840 [Lentisphaeria bacterium]|nr:hypothetical protein [Lentisphaeria bacterium]